MIVPQLVYGLCYQISCQAWNLQHVIDHNVVQILRVHLRRQRVIQFR